MSSTAAIRSLAAKLPPHVEGDVLVRLRPGASAQDVAADWGGTVDRFDVPESMRDALPGELALIHLPAGVSTAEAMVAAEDDPRLEYACSNDLLRADERRPDDLDPRLWGMPAIHAPEAWELTTGRHDGPVIAVIDTGVDYRHPDLAGNMWTNPRESPNGQDDDGNGVVDDLHGFDALTGSGDPRDDHRHGTHCAGTVGAVGNNGQGVVGVNWTARLMPVKFLDAKGSGTTAHAIEGLLYAARQGARITSNSWGGDDFSPALRDVLAASPALHVAAAGNARTDTDAHPHYPASYDLPNLISVAATTRDGELASYSNYGAASVDLGAPGSGILSTTPNGTYAVLDGTSMATPHVAGVAGLIAARFPEATTEQVRDRLLYSVDPLPSLAGRTVTGGQLNAARALEDDRVAPSSPTGLAVAATDFRSVRLEWTAGGDDAGQGSASAYRLAMDGVPVSTGAPAAAGTREGSTIRFLPAASARTVRFDLAAVDNVGNRSAPVGVTATVPAAHVAFEDDGERDPGWTAEKDWGRVSEPGRGLVWTDSPNGPYGSNRNDSLTSPPVALEGLSDPVLLFEARHHLEDMYDNVHVEVSADGVAWTRLESLTGKSGWSLHEHSLAGFAGKTVRVRFRIETDTSMRKDGFYLDRVVVAGGRQPANADATGPR